MNWLLIPIAVVLLCSTAVGQSVPERGKYFAIQVVDQDTGRGVPLVELTTTNRTTYYTDSNGLIAFYEPGLMGQDVHFLVKSHGYEYPKDAFGYAGLTLKVTEGGSAEIRIKRINIAERLYRITGQGIYSDSLLLGRNVPTKQPAINGLVMGQDSVVTAVYKGKLFWIWGDTGKPSYPLGNFHTTGATSLLPGKGGLDPDTGVDLTYFTAEDGFTKQLAPTPGPGPTWLSGMIVLPDEKKQERLYAHYSKVDQSMKTLEAGLMLFNDEKEQFEKAVQVPLDAPINSAGCPFRVMDQGTERIFFSPLTRAQADIAHLTDPSSYEAFTCLKPGSRKDKPEVDRDDNGRARFDWKRDTSPLFPQDEAKLIKDGKLRPEDALFHIQDADTGDPIGYHGASVSWNPYRGRWVMILSQIFGTFTLSEVWYLEADTPLGPWVYARKIVTHDKYTFYNPWHHTEFDKENGRIIFFEGTYTAWISGNDNPTPRYDYNQIMYKLDLSSPRLALPVPVYMLSKYGIPDRFSTAPRLPSSQTPTHPPIAFFAPDLPGQGTTPISLSGKQGTPDFYALPADTPNPPATTTPLYEFVRDKDGKHAYTTDASWSHQGFRRSERPLCLVWKNPMTVTLPLNRYRLR